MNYDKKQYFFEFEEESIKKRNNWEHKISTIRDNIPGFEFEHIEKMAYAAGPGSYTGARLAFTFLDTLSLILNKKFSQFIKFDKIKNEKSKFSFSNMLFFISILGGFSPG